MIIEWYFATKGENVMNEKENIDVFKRYYEELPQNAKRDLMELSDLQKIAMESRNAYLEFYDNCKNLDEVILNTGDEISKARSKMAEKVANILIDRDVFGVSKEEIINKRSYGYISFDVFRKLKDRKNELEKAKSNEYAYRQKQKAMRGKFVGGGFGLSGAVKGMAMAGAANMATGAVYDVFNVVGNAATKAAYNNRLRVLKGDGFGEQVANAIEHDCLLFIETLNDFLREKIGESLEYGIESMNKSNRIIEQVENKEIPENKVLSALCQAFKSFPLNSRFYELFAYKFGDFEGELVKSMEYFGMDSSQVKLIVASKVYRESYFGENYIPLMKRKLREEWGGEGFLSCFYDREINPYLLEDINNIPRLFIKDSIEILRDRTQSFTFEERKNYHYIQEIQNLTGYKVDWQHEVPLCLITLNYGQITPFIFITSKSVVIPSRSIEIQWIDEVEVSENLISFGRNGKVHHGAYENHREDILETLVTIILYVQFAYNLENKDKTIALLKTGSDNVMKDPYEFFKEDYIEKLDQYENVSQYVATLFEKVSFNLITVKNAVTYSKEIDRELKKYNMTLDQEKFVLIYTSDGFMANKNGVYITEEKLHYHINEEVGSMPINEVKSIGYIRDGFIINGNIPIKAARDKWLDEFVAHFMHIIKILQMKSGGKTEKEKIEKEKSNPIKPVAVSKENILIERVKNRCAVYKVSSLNKGYVASGKNVGPESIKKYEEVVKAFKMERSDEIFFYNNTGSLLYGIQGLIVCTSGVKIVSKYRLYCFKWSEFGTLEITYSNFTRDLKINGNLLLSLSTEGKKTYELLIDLQALANR